MLVAAVSVMFLSGAVGMLIAACLANPPTGPGYWRLVALMIIAGLAIGLGLRLSSLGQSLPPAGPVLGWSLAAATAALIALVVRRGIDPNRADVGLLWAAGISATVALISDPVLWSGSATGATGVVYAAGLASVGLVLGSVLLAMILAHWYLIEPRLPTAPLNRVLALFIGTEAVKLALLVAIVSIHLPEWTSAEGGLLRSFVLGDALFVAVRACLGILAPLGLGWMTWKTVQIRSIQSATGILYAAIVFVLFGEVISLYLSLSTGTPF